MPQASGRLGSTNTVPVNVQQHFESRWNTISQKYFSDLQNTGKATDDSPSESEDESNEPNLTDVNPLACEDQRRKNGKFSESDSLFDCNSVIANRLDINSAIEMIQVGRQEASLQSIVDSIAIKLSEIESYSDTYAKVQLEKGNLLTAFELHKDGYGNWRIQLYANGNAIVGLQPLIPLLKERLKTNGHNLFSIDFFESSELEKQSSNERVVRKW